MILTNQGNTIILCNINTKIQYANSTSTLDVFLNRANYLFIFMFLFN